MTTIHSLVLKDVDSGEVWSCHDQGESGTSIEEGVQILRRADQIIGHNIIDFDIPAIKKIYPRFDIPEGNVFDTLVASRLIWPEIRDQDLQLWGRQKKAFERRHAAWQARQEPKAGMGHNEGPPLDDDDPEPIYTGFPGQLIGRHGLEAWGHRLGLHKGDYAKEMKAQGLDPWAAWNPEMQSYCELDVEVTEALLRKIEGKNYAQTAFDLEHRFKWIMHKQEVFGFPFNVDGARLLQGELLARKADLEAQLSEFFPPWIEKTPFTPKRDNKTKGWKAGVTVTKEKEITFNPGSRDHIADRLIKLRGWKPTEFTDGGTRGVRKPKVDETTLAKLPWPEAKLLVQYLLVTKRLGMIGEGAQAWLKNVGDDGRMHGMIVTNGAVTGRCTHMKPNVAQTPSVVSKKVKGDDWETWLEANQDAVVTATNNPEKDEWEVVLRGELGAWGYDCRELFRCPEGWRLVGVDASGLELRCLAHFMSKWDGGAYARELLEGDIHTANQAAAGLPTRSNAKTFIYAFLYGAGDEKIGSIVAPTASSQDKRRKGAALREKFLRSVPALAQLKAAINGALKSRPYLRGLDSRELHIRSPHAALNTLLQSAGALSVKMATVIFDDEMQKRGYRWGEDYGIVAHVHDEWQTACRLEIVHDVKSIAIQSIRDAGEHFNFRCPLDGDARAGVTWADTH